jgi:hypothetical protein
MVITFVAAQSLERPHREFFNGEVKMRMLVTAVLAGILLANEVSAQQLSSADRRLQAFNDE